MPKYLIIESNVLRELSIPNQKVVINRISRLVNNYDYEIILCSKDESSQISLLQTLQTAGFPKVKAVAAPNSTGDGTIDEPYESYRESIDSYLISWDPGVLDEKAQAVNMLTALEAASKIEILEENRQDHILFTQDASLMQAFNMLNYRYYYTPLVEHFTNALSNLEEKESKKILPKQNNLEASHPVASHEYSNPYATPIQQLKDYINPESPKNYNWWTERNHKKNVKIAKKLLANLESENISKKTVFKSKCTPWMHTIRSNTLNSIFHDTEARFKEEHGENKGIFSCLK